MRAVSATTGAVSQRSMRSPIEQTCIPQSLAISASCFSKPPSGPVIIAALAFPRESAIAEDMASLSPVSYMKRGSSVFTA